MKNAIMIADTRVATIGTLLLQIVEKSPNTFDEAIIYHQDMSTSDQDILQKIMPCVFIEYNYQSDTDECPLYFREKFHPILFSLYEIFTHIQHYDTIIMCDTDVVIKKSLDNVVQLTKEHQIVCLREHIEDSYRSYDITASGVETPIYDYKIDTPMYSSGLVGISHNFIPKEDYRAWCYKATQKYLSKIILAEQVILNFLFQEFDIQPYPLMHGDYALFPKNGWETVDCHIVHSWGNSKFWNSVRLYQQYPLWGECYHKWVELGGSTMDLPEIEVSVVMPTYNPNLEYFKESLDSLLEQQKEWSMISYDNFEIIIIAEPFKTQEDERIFKDFIESYNDDRIIYKINETRMGISASLNQGIRMSKGKYIMRMDDDDIAMPERMFLQKKYLDENQDVHLCSSYFEYFGDMNEQRTTLEKNESKALSLITCPFDHPTVMFRKDWFEKNDLWYNETYYFVEDRELWVRAFDQGMCVGVIHQILLKHRWYNSQSSQTILSQTLSKIITGNLFHQLGIDLNFRQIQNISLYNGMLTPVFCLEAYLIFQKALKINKKMKKYHHKALKKIFRMRINETLHSVIIDRPILCAILRMIAKRIKNKTLLQVVKQDIQKVLNTITK